MRQLHSQGRPKTTSRGWLRIISPLLLTIAFFGLIVFMIKNNEAEVLTGSLVVLAGIGSGITWARLLFPKETTAF